MPGAGGDPDAVPGVSVIDLVLPPELAPAAALALVGTSFATSAVTAAFGIGGGAILLAVMASLVPPAALIPVHGVVQLGSNAGRAALLFGHLYRPALPAFALGSVVGAVLGGLVVVQLPPRAVEVAVGAFILWTVFGSVPALARRWAGPAGLVSSVLTMFFGATGPFVAAFVRSFGLERRAHVATQAALMTLQHGLKVAVFGLLGFAFGPWAGLAAAMIGAGFLGTVAGTAVLGRRSDAGFARVLDALLVVLGLHLVWSGLAG